MKAHILFFSFIITISPGLAGPPGPGPTVPDPVAPLLAEILQNNPAIEAARQDWQAAMQSPSIVSALPDPMLSYGYYFTNVETRIGPLNQRLGLSQKIPFPGKLGTARRQAQEAAEVAHWKYRAVIRDTAAQARTLLAELRRIDDSRAVLREQEALSRQTAMSAEALYETNAGKLPDVIRAKIATEDFRTTLSTLTAARISALAQIEALKGRNDRPLNLPSVASAPLPRLPSLGDAMKLSLVANQDLQATASAVARDAWAIRAAALEYYPDVTLGVDYTQSGERAMADPADRGNDPVMGTISINLPIWWNKLRAQKQAAEARHAASLSRQAQMSLETTAMIKGAHAMAEAALEQRAIFADQIVPEARRAYDSTLSNYTAGAAALTDVLEIQQTRLQAELSLIERTVAYLKALAQLEQAVGVPIGNMENRPDFRSGK